MLLHRFLMSGKVLLLQALQVQSVELQRKPEARVKLNALCGSAGERPSVKLGQIQHDFRPLFELNLSAAARANASASATATAQPHSIRPG